MESKLILTEYDNVYLAYQIQTVTFGLIFAIFVFVLRYTLHNLEVGVQQSRSGPYQHLPAQDEQEQAYDKASIELRVKEEP